MGHRIEVITKIADARANLRLQRLKQAGFKVDGVSLADVYTTDDEICKDESDKLSFMLMNPVTQMLLLHHSTPHNFTYAVEIGFLPGVTDNIGNTAREIAEDAFKRKINGQGVYSSQVMFLKGDLTKEDAVRIGETFANPLIQRISVKHVTDFIRDNGMDVIVPRVNLHEESKADLVDILNANDEELVIIGKQGIANIDGSRRGPLAMDLTYMKAVVDYFRKEGRNPTDVELESIAQTWSEHCKHTIFADPIDGFQDGLFRHFIKRATEEIRMKKGDKDFCVSVFSDNAGGIVFDDDYLICDKVETHNSPSALDPFGGSITGIVGVNRDPMGFGMGAKPFNNRYGFCFGNPNDKRALYKGLNKTQPMLSRRRIMDGVIEGVQVGANCSGIGAPQGFVYFDDSYSGKPLVFVGTEGIIPRVVNGKLMHEKKAMPGDYIVMVGGRVGKDGIHGATFSSEAIDSGSPATAVQIGDPITQKKMSDALIKEARDRGLYRSKTDNGAGGLSCSVAEMAKESGGCYVYLSRVPLKYLGLPPSDIWISESQERMTLAVPPKKWPEFSDLTRRRGVEATVIGEFTDSGKCIVNYNGTKVMDIDMEFLHNGLPQRPIKTTYTRKIHKEPEIECLDDLTESLHKMLARQNIASFEFISTQYDHEVQGGSVLKPLQGKGRVNGDATIVRPRLDSKKAVVLSHGINPRYSEIDTYDMAANAIDSAVRNAVCAGADLEHLAILDNFCWCSSNESERLGQLLRACQACYDYATEFGTPFISGKDSMFNDFKGYDENGNPIKISVLPTLLISSIGVMKDSRKAVSIDAKSVGDLVYILGETKDELGGSEYFAMHNAIGNNVPKVDARRNLRTYSALQQAIEEELIASAISVGRGGLGVALAKTAIAGQIGMRIDLAYNPVLLEQEQPIRDDNELYSESSGRVVVTINPLYRDKFERLMHEKNVVFGKIGKTNERKEFKICRFEGMADEELIVRTDISGLTESYKSAFRGY